MADWQKLNPELADYRAEWGARVNGQTLLEMPSGSVCIVGRMTCGSREAAELHALRMEGFADNDRRISAKTFESWLESPEEPEEPREICPDCEGAGGFGERGVCGTCEGAGSVTAEERESFWQMRESMRKADFRAIPILESYVATLLEDLQHNENESACMEDREPRDSGTVYSLPDSEYQKCKRSCERFMRENAEAIAEALELVPGEEGLRYGREYMTHDRIGYYFYMERVGHGVSFTDDGTPGEAHCLSRLREAANNFGYCEGGHFGDDGRVYIMGGDA